MSGYTSAATAAPFNHALKPIISAAPDLSRVGELTDADRAEALQFLAIRPVHTVVMTSFINDNGIESELHRGKFYGYRNPNGRLEGIALIGHATLVEASTDDALKAFAFAARRSETPIHLVMSDDDAAELFWSYYSGGARQPRLTCTELLFQLSFPFLVRKCEKQLRPATAAELQEVAEAQAAIAMLESGVDPLERDRDGFLRRVMKRIEQGRIFVVVENGHLIFKADVIAETNEVAYLEGVYVAPEYRGKGLGSACLSELGQMLLSRVDTVCLLSNVEFTDAHKCYRNAGFRSIDQCTTLFA